MSKDNFLPTPEGRENNHLKKIDETNTRLAIEFYNLIIILINKEFFLHNQLIQNVSKETAEEKESAVKNINHALTLLAAAKESIKKDGHTPLADYLTRSALSRVAEYLPEASITNIIKKLDESDKNNNKKSDTENSSAKHTPSFNNLVSRVNKALFPLQKQVPINYNKQIVIDFAADDLTFSEYGVSRAKKLNAGLLQVHPSTFLATKLNFSISENTNLTLIGHCASGLDYLSDNSGNRIYASQIAQQIYSKMLQMGVSLNVSFTIDLIACQAASSRENNPSFAERLIEELSKRGIDNVRVVASPTIMTTTYDGSQANLSRAEDRKLSASMRDREPHDVAHAVSNFFSSVGTLFSTPFPKLNVEKVTFQAKKLK